MEKEKRKGIWMALGMVVFILFLLYSEVFPWGFATHAYINDHLGKKRGLENANEIYGGMAPDVFNYLFDYPQYMVFLTEETHANFMEVWDSAGWGLQLPLAYGFVSHSVADFTAHGEETFSIEGYAMIKAGELLNSLPPEFRTKVGDGLLTEMLHIIVENAVDILVVRNEDPLIGRKITSAAFRRSPEAPLLLVRAYASDLSKAFGLTPLEATKFILSAEKEFRKSVILYGQILSLNEDTALRLISEQTADAAIAYLGLYGIQLNELFPDENDPIELREKLVQLIFDLTGQAILICAEDYKGEINKTINFVKQWLIANGVSY